MRILAIDTALSACSACVLEAGAPEPLAREQMAMERGHAEALMPMIERVMGQIEGGVTGGFASLSRVAVTIGPGSYTGLRVGISAARAIGLAAGIPVVGITSLAALAAPLIGRESGRLITAAIDARHGHVYVAVLNSAGRPVIAPKLASVKDAARAIGAGPATLVGSGAALVAQEAWAMALDVVVMEGSSAPDITWVARLGLLSDPAQASPRPLYLRAPEATSQEHARIARQ
jgi:tRNA threonylcarbamoyladenosine biosynthesis protein TsaB